MCPNEGHSPCCRHRRGTLDRTALNFSVTTSPGHHTWFASPSGPAHICASQCSRSLLPPSEFAQFTIGTGCAASNSDTPSGKQPTRSETMQTGTLINNNAHHARASAEASIAGWSWGREPCRSQTLRRGEGCDGQHEYASSLRAPTHICGRPPPESEISLSIAACAGRPLIRQAQTPLRTDVHEAAHVLGALSGAAGGELLLLLLGHLGGLSAHLTGTGQGAVNLTCTP